MENQIEIWKDVIDYDGIYKISDLGRIKSFKFGKEKILKTGIKGSGYYYITLCKNGITKNRTIHQIVAETFLNHIPNGRTLVVNHKNFNKLDNRLSNLEIVTMRENSNKKHLKSSSQYTGVCWDKKTNKWISVIRINGKQKYLGCFNDELKASECYKSALELINLNQK